MSNEIIESLLTRVQALEARLNDLCPPPNSSVVAPQGILPYDVKRRIEALEQKYKNKGVEEDEDTYYKGWDSPSIPHYRSFSVNDTYVSKDSGIAMFTRIYYIIPKMVLLDTLTMLSSNGSAIDFSLTVLPDIRKIKNVSVKNMRICIGFDFIPYLENFPCLTRLEIVDHPVRTALNRDIEKKRQIRDYCDHNDIELLMSSSPISPPGLGSVPVDTVSYNFERVNRDITEFQLTDAHVANVNVRSLDPFIGIYHMIPQLTSLEKLTIISNDEKGNRVLTLIPNVSMIRNESLIELWICDECEYIPYLANFPSLKRLNIVSRQGGMVQPRHKNFAEARDAHLRIPARKQKIKEYCTENGIELVSRINRNGIQLIEVI
jgi:hypothetical protein